MSLMMGNKDAYVAPVEKEEMLYYYCSMKTFISIIEEGSVWLRDLRDMNDPNEMMLGNEDWAQNILMAYETNKFRFEYNGKKDSEGMWDYLMNSRIKRRCVNTVYMTRFIMLSALLQVVTHCLYGVCMQIMGMAYVWLLIKV